MTQQLNIIIVDDEPIVCEVIETYFARRGHEVRVADNGEKGLALFNEHGADVLITDIYMPVKSGFEVIQDIRRTSSTAKVIAMTGYHIREGVELLEIVKRYGVDGVAEKPIDLRALGAMVEGFFVDQIEPEPPN